MRHSQISAKDYVWRGCCSWHKMYSCFPKITSLGFKLKKSVNNGRSKCFFISSQWKRLKAISIAITVKWKRECGVLFLKNTLCTAKLWHKKILQLTFMRSEVLRWLHTLSKYSSPWFPHRKQPCDVSDDPEDRIRAINRKWLSSKLHPIIITAKKQNKHTLTNNPKSPQDTKWQTTQTNDPKTQRKRSTAPKRARDRNTNSPPSCRDFPKRTSNASISKIKGF